MKPERIEINRLENDFVFKPAGKDAPLVYFVHGLGATYRFFYEGMVFFYKSGYSVMAHSRRGEIAGLHDGAEISLDLIIDDLEHAVRRTGARQIHIISSSFGGILALKLAERINKKVLSVTTIGSFLKFPWNVAHDILLDVMRTINVDRLPARDLGPLTPQIRFIRKRSDKVMLHVLTEYETFPIKSLASYLAILKVLDYTGNAPSSDCKKLFMHGREDDMVPLACLEVMKTSYNEARSLIIDRAGHGPFLSRPAITYEPVFEMIANSN